MNAFTTAFRRSQALSVAAKEEYQRCGHPEIDVEHLLLALLIVGGPSARILTSEGITLQTARDAAAQLHADHIASLGILTLTAPPTSTIPDPMIAETRWSQRALDVMGRDDSRRDDRVLLEALLDEPSGHVVGILDRLGISEGTIRQAIHQHLESPASIGGQTTDPEWQVVVYTGHIPVEPQAVWKLVSDPERRLEWDQLFSAHAEVSEGVLTTTSPRVRPDGKKLKLKPEFERTRHVVSSMIPGEVIEWEQSWPDAGDRGRSRRLRVHIHPDGIGSRVTLTMSRPAPRGLAHRLTSPIYRFFVWQELFARAGGMSRALR